MLKNGYKIILIKEGKYNLKQFNVSFLHLVITFIFLFFSGFGLVLFFSHQLCGLQNGIQNKQNY